MFWVVARSYTIESQWGNFGTLLPPRGSTFPHFEVWSYRACQPLQMWQISHFCEIHSLSYEASKFFAMLSLCVFLAAISPLGRTSYPRSLIKVIAHHSRLGRTFWHLIHGSVAKTAGGVARRSLVRANSNTILECTFPEENVNGACSGKKHTVARALLGLLLGGC